MSVRSRRPLESGVEVNPLLPYGIGIDTHRDFIQVCVVVQQSGKVKRYEAEFETTWEQLCNARIWAAARANVKLDSLDELGLRYTIESTGTYHIPVLLAWKGTPSVINPMLAGATKRKTDVLDARMLAGQAMSGLWRPSFVPSRDQEVLRVIVNMRNECGRNATRCLNRINNNLLRFGHTVGREASMRDGLARGIIDDMTAGRTPIHPTVCPAGLPEPVRCFFIEAYNLYDLHDESRTIWHKRATTFLSQTTWPTQEKRLNGSDMINLLKTVPGVGDVTALMWLTVVGDPRRFDNAGQVAAYCGSDPSLKVSAGKVTSHVKRKGNATLHHVLKNIAAQLVRRADNPLGVWGYALQKRHGKGGWSRAISAVSRRLCIFLWHVQRTGNPFDWTLYTFIKAAQVDDVPVEDMELGSRYTHLLIEANLRTSQQISNALNTTLPQQKGIGAACLKRIKSWVDLHRKPDPLSRKGDSIFEGKYADGPDESSSTRRPESSAASTTTRSAPAASSTVSIGGEITTSSLSERKSKSRCKSGVGKARADRLATASKSREPNRMASPSERLKKGPLKW